MPTELTFPEYCEIYRQAYQNCKNSGWAATSQDAKFNRLIREAVTKKREAKTMGNYRKGN